MNQKHRPLLAVVAISAAFGSAAFAGGRPCRIPPPPPRTAQTRTPGPNPIALEGASWKLLTQKCFSCHGPQAQLAGLRLDSRNAILKGGKDGPAVNLGEPSKSLLLSVIRYDGKLKMPPGGKLKDDEIGLLERWVANPRLWETPNSKLQSPMGQASTPNAQRPTPNAAPTAWWSFRPIVQPPLPKVKNRAWVRNPIDAFVLARLEKAGLKPSPYADRRTLIRRVSFDLTGLPPTAEEVEAFLGECAAEDHSSAAPQPTAYERLVDRLLASPHYGERMAQHWLDLARYADSDGYHDDTTRLMWRYRDYVINAFNANKPFDRFTVEQLAGDVLPNATVEQKVASAFNRCGPTSSEGGAIPEEVLNAYAVDRVNTTGAVWLGLTIQCTQCHNHKYDPLTTRDYYSLASFFNQVPEEALYRGTDAPPTLLIPTPEQQKKLDDLDGQIKEVQAEIGRVPGAEKDRLNALNKKVTDLQNARKAIDRDARVRIMQDVPTRRPTFVLLRGDYRSHGDEVQPAVPAVLGSLPSGPSPRLALADWIVDPQNPLTARVTANRFWQMLWGTGLVKTSEDFGVRGERPSHPELLDWLAFRFLHGAAGPNGRMGERESGGPAGAWDVKALLKLMVMSATYQQASEAKLQIPNPKSQSPRPSDRRVPGVLVRTPKTEHRTPKANPQSAIRNAQLQEDPENRLLSRGARYRLPAEFIRDNALAIAGLLDRDRAVGGPSVKPYQPGDLWRELSAGDDPNKSYVQDHGPDLYRRGLYTVWKRSILYPAFAVFDAPKRETCTCRRLVTNTPLQAFVTLNDPTYVEAARVFAQRILKNGGATLDSRLDYALHVALGHAPTLSERQALTRVYQKSLALYQTDKAGALKLASTGEAPRPVELDPSEHAAWTCVCNAILNMDEVLSKE